MANVEPRERHEHVHRRKPAKHAGLGVRHEKAEKYDRRRNARKPSENALSLTMEGPDEEPTHQGRISRPTAQMQDPASARSDGSSTASAESACEPKDFCSPK
jgi:hypothetical protein